MRRAWFWGVLFSLIGCSNQTPGGALSPPDVSTSRWHRQDELSNRNHVCRLGATGVVACSDQGRVEGVERAVAVRTGSNSACALRDDGRVTCWGGNDFGQLGRGSVSEDEQFAPAEVVDLERIVQIQVGAFTACALDDTAALRCWGQRLGEGTLSDSRPRRVDLDQPVNSFSVGWGYACAVLQDGTLWCWGQLGDGFLDSPERLPVRVAYAFGGSPIREVFAGPQHACVVDAERRLFCWGLRPHLGLEDNAPVPVEIDVGPFETVAINYAMTCVLSETIRCFGSDWNRFIGTVQGFIPSSAPQAPWSLEGASAVALGHVSVCGLFEETVQCVGYEPNPMLDSLNMLP